MTDSDAAAAVVADCIAGHTKSSSAQLQTTGLNASSIENGVAADNRICVCSKRIPYINLAAYYNRVGDPKLAVENARKALQLAPKSDAGNFQLAKALDRLQQWPEAAEALNRAIEANPSASSYHYVLSGVYRHLGKSKESQEQMELFRKLEKAAAEFEQKRREAHREEFRPGDSSPR